MSSIDDDRNQILTVHRNWWHANERWDIPLMKTCFPVGPNYLMFNFNWHPYFGIEEKVRLWQYYKKSGMTMDPPDVRIMKFEVIGDIAYIANEFEITSQMPAQPNALIEEVQTLPQPGETMIDRGRSTEVYKRDDGEGRLIWKMWHFHCSPLPRPMPHGRASTTPHSRAAAWARIHGASRCEASSPPVTELSPWLDSVQVQEPRGHVLVRLMYRN